MRLILQAGSTKDSSAQRSISSPTLGALALPSGIVQGSRLFKQRSGDSSACRGSQNTKGLAVARVAQSVVSSWFRVGLRVLCGPILFVRCYSLSLLQRFLILLLYLIHAATTLRFIAISLSLVATTIKSLQYNYHIATPLVCVAISKHLFPSTQYVSQYLCLHWQGLSFVLPQQGSIATTENSNINTFVDAKSTHWNLKTLFAKLQNADQACQSI